MSVRNCLLLGWFLFQLALASPARGQGWQWSGDLTNGTVVPAKTLIFMTANTRIPPGAVVTLGAGTIVKSSGTASLKVEGALLAHGTSADPVIFTDSADDSAGGDTDKNGPTTGYPGRWGQVQFAATSGGSLLQYAEFRFGGAGAAAEVTVEGAPVVFEECTVRHSRVDGLRIVGANPVITGGNFFGNWGSALSMDLASNPSIRGARAATNAINGLSVDAGALAIDGVWNSDLMYFLRGTVTVPAGRRLVLGAGQVIKAWGSQNLSVAGTLQANGVDGRPVIFTSLRDDSAGGDGNSDGPSDGYNGEWGRVEFLNTSSSNQLSFVEFRFGGAGSVSAVLIDGAQTRFSNCLVRNSRVDGLRLLNSDPVIESSGFYANWASALSMDLASNPAIRGIRLGTNAINGLSVDAGALSKDGFWDDSDVAYYLKGNVTVPAGRKLTIGAGQVIKMWGSPVVSIMGTLSATGASGQPIVFTSLADDSAGGDTNNDKQSQGYNGQWGRVEFASTSTQNELAWVEFRYGGAGSSAQVVLAGAPARFENCVFRDSRVDGLRIQGCNPTIVHGSFSGNWQSALSMDLSSIPAIQGVQMRGNAYNALSLDAGALAVDGVWANPEVVYHLRGAVTVPAHRKLTIGAGQIVKTAGPGGLLVVGSLRASGSASQPIVITSLRDDSVGGDTGNDGPSSGYNGEWSRVEFTGVDQKSQLAHVEFRYGGANSSTEVSVAAPGVEFIRCAFRSSRADGLRVAGSSPLITDGVFSDNWGSALSMDLGANPGIIGGSFENNAVNGLSVDGGVLPRDNAWDDPDVVYYLRDTVTVPAGRILTIAPGQVIKASGQTMVSVAGTVHAIGSSSAPIVFTCLRDDSVGGDTGNDHASQGYNGSWGRVEFSPTSAGNELVDVEFRYGGAGAAAQVVVNGAPVRFERCVFRHSRSDGLRILGSQPVVAFCYFHDNWASAVSMDLSSDPVITQPEIAGNLINGLAVDGGTLSADANWDDPDIVYYIVDSVSIPSGRRLAIAPGQIIKLSGKMITVAGTLQAVGTPDLPIVFTSLRDDSAGGDTNKDGPTGGFNGDWGRVEFTAASASNELGHVEFRYGGGSNSAGTLVFSGLQANLNACLIRQSASHAVAARNGAQLVLSNSILAQNWGSGVRAESGALVTAVNNTLDANDRGVWADASFVTLMNSFVTSNRTTGLTLSGNATLAARYDDFHNARNFDGLPSLTGKDGNFEADPLFVHASSFDYGLKPSSPGVDAGLGDGAPPSDFFGQMRVDDPGHPNNGAGNPPYVDIGAIELDRWVSEMESPRRGGEIVAGDTLRFSGVGQAEAGTSGFSWDFGNGQTSGLENPGLVTFRSAGTRTITFAAMGADGTADPNPAKMELTVVAAQGPLPDLEVVRIEPPAQVAVGQPVEVVYVVRNRGPADLAGNSWVDALYLSSDEYLDAADVRLDSQAVSLRIPAGGSYTNTFRAVITPSQLLSGVLYLLVSADDGWAVLEERQLNNELALPIDAAIPELRSGVPHTGRFTRAGAGQFYRFEVSPGENLRVRMDDLNDGGVNEVYLRRGQLPSREIADFRSEGAARADQDLIISAPTPGIWYLLAYGSSVPDQGGYTIEVDESTLTLGEIFPGRSGQLDGAVFRVRGAGFVPGIQAALVAVNGTSYPASNVAVNSFSLLELKLNLSGVPPGAYGLRVTAGGVTATLDQAITVFAGGQAHLETQLIVPDVVGYHQLATLYVEYRNSGTAAMPAPLISVSGIQKGRELALLTLDAARITTGLWVSGLPEGFSHTVHFLASGQMAGWLQAGESAKVPIYYAGWQQPWDLTYPPIEFNLLATTTESIMPIDWASLAASLKPGVISPEAWTVVAANLQAEIGPTWGSLMSVLSQDGAYFGQFGQSRVGDVETLFGFELAQADNNLPFNLLEDETDATALSSGLPLVFERTFPALISARYDLGPLGRGWKHCWETGLTVSTNGSVVVRTRGGGITIFQPDLRGGFVSPGGGNYGKLSRMTDGRFRLSDPDGITALYRSDGLLESLTDRNGRSLSLAYSGALLSRLRHSDGSEFQLGYSPAGRLIGLTDDRGRVVRFAYDAAEEHLMAVQYPEGRAVTYRYGVAGAEAHALLQRNASAGGSHFYRYDERGRVAGMRLAANGPELTMDYRAGGEVGLSLGAAAGAFYFDSEGRMVKTRDGGGFVQQMEYDSQGRMTDLIDSRGRRTSARYDSKGRLISVTDVLGQTASFGYDSSGQLAAITDPKGQRINYEQDSAGNLLQVIQPDGARESFTHNSIGRLTEWTRPGGASIQFAYDAGGRVAGVQASDGAEYSYAYDSRGKVAEMRDGNGTTRYSYDTNGFTARVDLPGGRWLSFTYDSVGRRSGLADQTGFKVQYRYNESGGLQRLEDDQGRMLAEYEYDGLGRPSRIKKGNGTFTTYAYAPSGRLVGITNAGPAGEMLSRFSWTLDADGRIGTLDSLQGQWSYDYDGLGQLARARFISGSAMVADQDVSFEYDAAGNRSRMVSQGQGLAYTANVLNQYVQAGEARLAYDAQGSLTNRTEGDQAWNYFYDSAGRLMRVETPAGIWSYEYDASGNRVAVVHAGQRREFVYDPFSPGAMLVEYGSAGLLAHYVQGAGLVGRVDAAGSVQFYDFDQTGSTVGMTDAAGAYLNQYLYSPFGELLDARELVPNPFQYVGQFGVVADGSGLYHMQARDYLPGLGRFVSRDPVGQGAGLNLYTYADNDPVEIIDPRGTDDEFPGYGVFFDRTGQSQTLYLFRNSYDYGWGRYFQAMREHGFMTDEEQGYLDRGWQSFNGVLELQNVQGWLRNTKGKLLAWGRNTSAQLAANYASSEESFTRWLGSTWSGIRSSVSDWYNQEAPRRINLVTQWLSDMLPQVRSRVDDALRWVGNAWNSVVAWALDPNEKTAPAGGGTNHYVVADGVLSYRIEFENDPQATAPAQYVSITDDLDGDLDWTSLEWSELAFGDVFIPVPPGYRDFSIDQPIQYEGRDLMVQVRAGLDLESGRLQVVFSTMDPVTGLPPGVLLGFLPPEDGTGRGQGYVSYKVRPKAGLPSGTVITNVAQINFDFTQTIETDQLDEHDPGKGVDPSKQARNTLDAASPVSEVRALPVVSPLPNFTVAWEARDEVNGSGVAGVDLFVSTNGGAWTLWLSMASGTEAAFSGSPGVRYSFYSVAHDRAGHVEAAPEGADATTTVAAGVVLRVADSGGGRVTLVWPSAADLRYTVLEAATVNGPWAPLTGQVDRLGTGAEMACEAGTTAGMRFYRLGVRE